MQENTTQKLLDIEKLSEMLDEKNYRSVKELLSESTPWDIAEILNGCDGKTAVTLFRLLPKDGAADTFAEMDTEKQSELIRSFSDSELRAVINELYADDAVDIIEEMPANAVKRILAEADAETRAAINELLKYSEDSAGSIMTTEYVRLEKDFTVKEALTRIRRTGENKKTVYTCYVTDESKRLLGVVSAKQMLLAEEETEIGDIMEENVIFVTADTDRELAAKQMHKYELSVLPVTDSESRLVGIITVDDAMDVILEETAEDIEKMAAMLPSDKPYLKTGVWHIWKNRIPWLLLLMVTATFTGQIITGFEASLAALGVATLTAFIPMLMGTGGNAGGQASATIIRELATGDIKVTDVFKILRKEVSVSLLCGITLAAAGFLKIFLIDNLVFGNGVTVAAASAVCITMGLTVVAAKIVGCLLPIIAKVCRLDPAVMASPFITTVIDAVSLLIYFNTAILILS